MTKLEKGVYEAYIGTVKTVGRSQYGNPIKEAVLVLVLWDLPPVRVRTAANSMVSYSLDNFACRVQNQCFVVNKVKVSINGRGTIDRVDPIEEFRYTAVNIELVHPDLYSDEYTLEDLQRACAVNLPNSRRGFYQ